MSYDWSGLNKVGVLLSKAGLYRLWPALSERAGSPDLHTYLGTVE